MLLAAHALKLATCWVGAFKEEEARKALNLPNRVRPVAIIPIGHSTGKPMARSRIPPGKIVHYETYSGEI